MIWSPVTARDHRFSLGAGLPRTEAVENGIVFAAEIPEGLTGSVLLYDKKSKEPIGECSFPDEPYMGRLFALKVSGIRAANITYNFRIGDRTVTDPAAQVLCGAGGYGQERGNCVRGGFISGRYSWGEDHPLGIPFRDSVLYELNVRGFTRGKKSGVRNKGTFSGIVEKIPYLKSLGITTLVLMPCYDFDENGLRGQTVVGQPKDASWILREEAERRVRKAAKALRASGLADMVKTPWEEGTSSGIARQHSGNGEGTPSGNGASQAENRVNFWGFGPGWLFAPKASYCAGNDPYREFCSMVKALHQAGIEVIMEMDFNGSVTPHRMSEVLIWWRSVYHVDGFMLFGNQNDINAVCRNPALSGVKLISEYFDGRYMYPDGRKNSFRNMAECNGGFRNDTRRLLKGDEGVLQLYLSRFRYNPEDTAVVNALTTHDGFTLMDLVSYNECHNESSGEGSGDASGQFSWNCGVEGPSRRRDVAGLRLRLIRNAFTLLLLAQGTPMILAGDEFGNSQGGNSNAWCVDSEESWLDRSSTVQSRKILETVRELTAFRRSHPLLHREKELSSAASGEYFPQISCHGESAWLAPSGGQDRSAGLMLCDRECVYIAYNFHWETRDLALPYLPDGRTWKFVFSTSGEEAQYGRAVSVPGRSIVILEG